MIKKYKRSTFRSILAISGLQFLDKQDFSTKTNNTISFFINIPLTSWERIRKNQSTNLAKKKTYALFCGMFSPNFSGTRIFLINRALLHFSIYCLNPSQATVLFLYPMETSQNLRFSQLFREYGNGTMAWDGWNNKGRRTKVLFTLLYCASKNIMKGTIEATLHRLKESIEKIET